MSNGMRIFWGVVFVIVVAGGIWYFAAHPATAPATGTSGTLVASVNYACNANKTIAASYYSGPSTASTDPNQPPMPGGSVQLALSDGRTMTLPQTISADGARYANADESFVFWNKGNGATVTEGAQPSYTCIQVANDPGGLPQAYENGSQGFSIRVPANYTAQDGYSYQNLGPGKNIGGVKFTIDPALAAGTNLSDDSYVSVEEIPGASSTCSAALFVQSGATASTVTEGDTTYSLASSTDAAAGNRYEETVYALPGTNPCMAVRYFIHYGVIDNYPAGTVKEFDKSALLAQFDAIRKTLTIGH